MIPFSKITKSSPFYFVHGENPSVLWIHKLKFKVGYTAERTKDVKSDGHASLSDMFLVWCPKEWSKCYQFCDIHHKCGFSSKQPEVKFLHSQTTELLLPHNSSILTVQEVICLSSSFSTVFHALLKKCFHQSLLVNSYQQSTMRIKIS